MVNDVLLTGSTGLIGSAIKNYLQLHAVEVIAPTRDELNIRYIDHIQHYCGSRSFGAMILCHGTYGVFGMMKNLHMSDFNEAISTNLMGTMALIRYAQVSGPIIVFGGGQGGRIPLPERASFAASKAALNALVLTGASEGLDIYGVAPGPMDSKMTQTLLNSSEVSSSVKNEMRKALENPGEIKKVLEIIDHILNGNAVPGRFYAAREWNG